MQHPIFAPPPGRERQSVAGTVGGEIRKEQVGAGGYAYPSSLISCGISRPGIGLCFLRTSKITRPAVGLRARVSLILQPRGPARTHPGSTLGIAAQHTWLLLQ